MVTLRTTGSAKRADGASTARGEGRSGPCNRPARGERVHQNHDYAHHPQCKKGVWEGPEAQRNLALAGGWDHVYTLRDCTHRFEAGRVRANLTPHVMRRRALAAWRRGRPSA